MNEENEIILDLQLLVYTLRGKEISNNHGRTKK